MQFPTQARLVLTRFPSPWPSPSTLTSDSLSTYGVVLVYHYDKIVRITRDRFVESGHREADAVLNMEESSHQADGRGVNGKCGAIYNAARLSQS